MTNLRHKILGRNSILHISFITQLLKQLNRHLPPSVRFFFNLSQNVSPPSDVDKVHHMIKSFKHSFLDTSEKGKYMRERISCMASDPNCVEANRDKSMRTESVFRGRYIYFALQINVESSAQQLFYLFLSTGDFLLINFLFLLRLFSFMLALNNICVLKDRYAIISLYY